MSVLPENGSYKLVVKNKFGAPVRVKADQQPCSFSATVTEPDHHHADHDHRETDVAVQDHAVVDLFRYFTTLVNEADYNRLRWFVEQVARKTAAAAPAFGIEILTLCLNRRYPTGDKKRSSLQVILSRGLAAIFNAQAPLTEKHESAFARVTWETRHDLRAPQGKETTLIIDARGFSSEGADCDASLAVRAYEMGWKRFIHYNSRGTRFHAAGFGPGTRGVRVDCYDNPGDYLASGMDGLEAYVHGNAQDQLCQIAKSGKLVVYGDVGQTFLYGAKGGEIYVLGNVAGRPMINAVGRPRVVINGTALDFLAESLMAGNPHRGGGFAIVNGMNYDDDGRLVPLELPYPGSNLLSLASGGAIFIRDPHRTLVKEQLNGGVYRKLTDKDWKLILPYLEENERLFGIEIAGDLLTVNGVLRKPHEVYRKVVPAKDADPEEDDD
jgi:glutamate synthase domain-containing protein 3